ncbi:Uncharacterized protein FWK35_00027136 [Aphis craccivora]|uniref:Uncharacterized protein n=1 Tax=Aphis craccivora TaxID=307492 RepID=A0A6G0YMI1_APHCR|nr:Uncharacterized protein FWK35_00027136 [Aphis craccivora]
MITYQCLRGSESSFFSFCRRSEIKYAKENPEENHSSLLTTKIDKTSRSEGLFILNSLCSSAVPRIEVRNNRMAKCRYTRCTATL